jgi:3-phenylpropionate/trans-cinnamate dioxygenase ferredoxin reductase subunit
MAVQDTAVQDTMVVVGGGLAGAKAAETLRAEGFGGRVVLVAEEPERPYERPPLSKDYLNGGKERDVIYVHDADWYAEHDVELRSGTRAVGLDPGAHEVELDDGERLRYRALLLATGAAPRRLPVPGGDLDGVLTLRTAADSDRLKAELSSGDRSVAVVGAGWIGLEVAAAARSYGNAVTVVEPQPQPLRAVLGDELGAVFARLHRAHGVDLRLSTGVRELRGDGGRVVAVVTDAGEVPADLVVVGVGVAPRTELAEQAGLDVDNGVVVDPALRTSAPDVYAAGDIASWPHPRYGRRIRVEHWANALNGGPAAARAMLGQEVTYDRLPYFFTDQYDLGMEYSGLSAPGDTVVCRGDVEGGEFVAFWLDGDRRVQAAMNVNVWDLTDQLQQLVRSGRPVDPTRLADPDVALGDLADTGR